MPTSTTPHPPRNSALNEIHLHSDTPLRLSTTLTHSTLSRAPQKDGMKRSGCFLTQVLRLKQRGEALLQYNTNSQLRAAASRCRAVVFLPRGICASSTCTSSTCPSSSTSTSSSMEPPPAKVQNPLPPLPLRLLFHWPQREFNPHWTNFLLSEELGWQRTFVKLPSSAMGTYLH